MREKIRRWVNSLGEFERTLPLVIYQGRYYSPNEILTEIETNSALGVELQGTLDAGVVSTTATSEEIERLAAERLIILNTEKPGSILMWSLEQKEMTSEEIIDAVQKRTEFGKSLINTEIGHMRDLIELYRR